MIYSLVQPAKAKAALEGSTLRDLVLKLVQRGLSSSNSAAPVPTASDLPSISLGAPMALSAENLSNANLSALADE